MNLHKNPPRRSRRSLSGFGLTVIALFASAETAAQGTDIRGIVSDSLTGSRLPSANVVISGLGRGGVTNTSGFYLIPAVPAGTVEIAASCVGYQRQSRQLQLVGGAPITVNFRLVPRAVEGEEVLIEGKRVRDTSAVSGSLHTILPDELQRIPGPVQGDVFRSMSLLPGVVSTADVSSRFYVRGGAGDQNLILFDGMRIYNPYHAFGIFSVFDPDIVKSVDVQTGAFPAGYWGRLSSVLDIKTRNGNGSRLAGSADLSFLSSRLRLEGPIGEDNTFIVSGQKSLFNTALGSFLKNPPPTSFYDLYLKTVFGGSTGQISLRAYASGDDVRSDNPNEPDHFWRNQAAAASASTLFSDWTYVEASVTSSRSEMRRDAKSSNLIIPARSVVSEVDLRAEFLFYTSSQDLWVGGFESVLVETDYSFKTRGGVQQQESSMQPDFELWLRREQRLGNLRATVGVQVDVPQLLDRGASLMTLQPRLNVAYALAPGWRAKASYGVFTQKYIALTNEDDVTSLFDGWVYLPKSLRPEQAIHYVVGVETDLSPSVAASLLYYLKNYRSLALYNREKVYPDDPDYIAGTGKSYGMETLLRFTSTPVDLYAAYALSWATVTANGFSYSPRYDRRHSLNLLGVFRPLRGVEVSLRWEFGSGYPFTQNAGVYDRLTFPNLGGDDYYRETGTSYIALGSKNAARLPAYHRLDASATYRFSLGPIGGTAGLNLINVYDRKNPLYVDRKTGQVTNMLSFFPSAVLRLEL